MKKRNLAGYLVAAILALLIPGCENPVTIQVQADVARALGDAGLVILYGSVPITPEEVFTMSGTPIIAEESATAEFTIRNDGVKVLELTGELPVSFSTTGSEFTLSSSQPATAVSPGESVRFTVSFAPLTLGRKVASVTIESNVPDLPSFVFLIEGYGSAPSATAVPTGLSAAQGTSTVDVDLTWDTVSDATDYYIYRDTVDVAPDTYLATSAISAWTDTTATPGQLYYYWVRAVAPDPKGLSDYSASETGYRKLGSVTMTSASEGTSNAHISIVWQSVAGASTYEFYRSIGTAPQASYSATFAGVTGTSHDDAAPPAERYYYWARARASSSDSVGDWSPASVNGYREMPPPTINEVYSEPIDGGFHIEWSAVEKAENYRINIYYDHSPTVLVTQFVPNPIEVSPPLTYKDCYMAIPTGQPYYVEMQAYTSFPTGHWSIHSPAVLVVTWP